MAHALDSIEQFFSSADQFERGAELTFWVNAQLNAGNVDQLAVILPHFIVPYLDYTTASSLHRALSQLRKKTVLHDRMIKVAVVGSFTTNQLVSLLDLFLWAGGISAEFYQAEYGTLQQEFLDPDSGLHHFRPDFVHVATTWRDLGYRPELTDSRQEVDRKIEAEVSRWTSLWRIAHDRLGCQILQNNFDAPAWRVLANLEAKHPGGFGRFVSLVNHALQDAAPAHVTIHDIDHLAASSGRWEWGNARFYHLAKLPCSPDHLVDYAHSLASLILAQSGLGKKCLVLDLDNTLWGGVIGDDGLGGIRLGQGDPESEAFVAFQHYVRELGKRGVILAVCSKNSDSVAREVFRNHPEMALRLDDISCFVANWDDKATNLSRIARELNIGVSSLVFVDDNPAERSIVHDYVPKFPSPRCPRILQNTSGHSIATATSRRWR